MILFYWQRTVLFLKEVLHLKEEILLPITKAVTLFCKSICNTRIYSVIFPQQLMAHSPRYYFSDQFYHKFFFFFFLLCTHFLRVTEAPFKLNLNVWLNWGTGYYSKQVYHYWLARQVVLSGAQHFQPWFVNSDINQEYPLSKKCERSHRAELLVSVRSTQWMTFLASL